MLIDTHCHLDATEFAADRAACHATAQAVGVGKLLIPAVSVANFPAVTAVCRDFAGCYPAYGIHPLYLDTVQSVAGNVAAVAQLADYLHIHPAVAVGEIGLDFFVPGLDVVQQEALFIAQLKIAQQFNLPVVLHVRRAVDAILKNLRRYPVVGGIAHAFNGSRQQAEMLINLGFKLGFGGAMTYLGSRRIRELARTLPLNSLVLETDSPDIPPAWLGGQRNSPAELARIAQCLAELRGLSVTEIATITHANALAAIPGLGGNKDNLLPHGYGKL